MNQSLASRQAPSTDVARQIRLLRERRNFSQQALAQASGLSRNTLSLLERGQTSPTLDTLQKIADGLKVDISAFFQESVWSGPIYDKADPNLPDPVLELSPGKGAYGIDGLISALILRLEPDAKCGSVLPHSGEEFIYCLSGRCLFTVDQHRYVLETGDSLRFDGRLPHFCQNLGYVTFKALVIFLDFIP